VAGPAEKDGRGRATNTNRDDLLPKLNHFSDYVLLFILDVVKGRNLSKPNLRAISP